MGLQTYGQVKKYLEKRKEFQSVKVAGSTNLTQSIGVVNVLVTCQQK